MAVGFFKTISNIICSSVPWQQRRRRRGASRSGDTKRRKGVSPQRGQRSEERCDLANAFFTFNLIPIPDYSRRTKEHCRTTVADLGLDYIRQAGLLLRREPLRLCGLNLGLDHVRQASLLLWRDQLLPAGLFLWSDHLPAPPAGPIPKAVSETK